MSLNRSLSESVVANSRFEKPKTTRKPVCVALMLLALMCPAAWAHHLWMIPSGQELFVARGLAPDRMDAYDPKHVVMLKAFDRSGREIPIRRADQAHQARFSSEGAAARRL